MLNMRLKQAVQTLNKYYGDGRNPVTDLGGYAIYVDNPEEWLLLEKEYHLDTLPPEYIDVVENNNSLNNNHTYFEVLYLLSSDYGIYVFMNETVEKLIQNR